MKCTDKNTLLRVTIIMANFRCDLFSLKKYDIDHAKALDKQFSSLIIEVDICCERLCIEYANNERI